MIDVEFTDLEGAGAGEAVVVIDVLRAFTVEPWMIERGAARILTVVERAEAFALRDRLTPGALLAGERGGRQVEGFDLGNSPSQISATDLHGAVVVHRTSAGTLGLHRAAGSGVTFAASFVNAAATVRALQRRAPSQVTFVVTGASLGRDGDEDLAAAELIASRLRGEDPDPRAFLARVATSDAGRAFAPGGPDWAPPEDLTLACEVDRVSTALVAARDDGLGAVEVRVDREMA